MREVIELELAAGPDGRLRALRGRLSHDVGAYTISGAAQPDIIVPHMISAYVVPAMGVDVRVVLTNATPTGFVRGGGRPLGNFAMERLMDRLARVLDLEPAEVRRRNLVQPGQMPYDTGFPAGNLSNKLTSARATITITTADNSSTRRTKKKKPRSSSSLQNYLRCRCTISSANNSSPLQSNFH